MTEQERDEGTKGQGDPAAALAAELRCLADMLEADPRGACAFVVGVVERLARRATYAAGTEHGENAEGGA
jgi:hypothetical protein